MAEGIQIFDGSGNVVLDSNDYTFRYIGTYGFTNNPSGDVVVSVPGVVAGVFFAVLITGFAVVETNQVRIKPQFGSGTGANSFDLFRI